jgi:hypothetical protein
MEQRFEAVMAVVRHGLPVVYQFGGEAHRHLVEEHDVGLET